jgi:predicted nuclease with TOPRIM domain
MKANDYCKGMQMELTAWKAKLYDVLNKFDALGTAEKEKAFPNIENLRMVVADLEDKICNLEVECPTDWGTHKKVIDDAHVDLRSKYEETMDFIGKAAPVSVSG